MAQKARGNDTGEKWRTNNAEGGSESVHKREHHKNQRIGKNHETECNVRKPCEFITNVCHLIYEIHGIHFRSHLFKNHLIFGVQWQHGTVINTINFTQPKSIQHGAEI